MAALEQMIEELGPDNIAAVITETMLGVAGIMGHDEYLPAVRRLTRKHGILWIDDEVICGFGRLGKWFSYQLYDGVRPDLMTIGKGMNGCILPVGGSRSESGARRALRARSLVLGKHMGRPSTGRCDHRGEYRGDDRRGSRGARCGDGDSPASRPGRAARPPSLIGHIGGQGLYHAVDLVGADGSPIVPEDRAFDFTGDLSGTPTAIIREEAAKHGVWLTGFVPNTIKAAPPLTITADEIDLTLEAFDAGLQEIDRRYGG